MKNQKELKALQHFQEIFQPLEADEIANLTALLIRDGCMNPIVVWKGKDIIVDGHNRYAICQANDIKYDILEKSFSDEEEAELWIRQFGAGRRNLNQFVRIENSEKILALMGVVNQKGKKLSKEEKAADAKFREELLPTEEHSRSIEKAVAKQAKVGHGVVFKYNFIRKHGDLDDKTAAELRSGKKTINEVFKKRKTEIYREKEEAKKNTKAIKLPANQFIRDLWNCDISKITDDQIKDDSLDVIITDPPYPRDFLICWKYLAEFAAKKLKEGGVLIAMSGQSFLPEVYRNMTVPGLDYYWTGCIYTPGASPNLREKRLRTNWKPYFIYTKGGYGPKGNERTFLSSDVVVSEYKDTAEGQKFHK